MRQCALGQCYNSLLSVYNLSLRKYLFAAILLQPLVYLFANLVRILISSFYSSLLNYFTLGIPTLGLLVTFRIGILVPKQLYIYNSISLFYYIKIYYLNSSILSLGSSFSRSLKSLYFLIIVLTF